MNKIKNQYKKILITNIKPEWWPILVEQKLENCRISNDGLYAILKIPVIIKSVDDVPDIWKADYLANQPYLNHDQIKEELKKPEWISNII